MRPTASSAFNDRPATRWAGGPATPVGLAALFVLMTLGLQLWPGVSELLRFSRPVYEQGAVWQVLTAQWVHLSRWHAAANAFAFVLIVFVSSFWLRWPLQALALGGGYIGVAAVVAFDPNCSYYAGASGALHGLLAGNAVNLAFADRPQKPALDAAGHSIRVLGMSLAVLAFLALKLWLEAGSTIAPEPGVWTFAVYHPAHVAGALGGMALVVLVLALRALTAAEEDAQRRQ